MDSRVEEVDDTEEWEDSKNHDWKRKLRRTLHIRMIRNSFTEFENSGTQVCLEMEKVDFAWNVSRDAEAKSIVT